MSEHEIKRNKKRGGRILLTVLAVLVLLALLLAAGVWFLFGHYYGKMNTPAAPVSTPELSQSLATPSPSPTPTPEPTLSPEDSAREEIERLEQALVENLEAGDVALDFDSQNVYHILLIGSDTREQDVGRSDSMILVSINRDTRQIVMTSILRDIYLKIPGWGSNRVNAAFAWGGPELLLETIQTNFKMPVDDYVQVDFESFVEVVDLLGGVEVEVSELEQWATNRLLAYDDLIDANEEGKTLLNGTQALAYSRIRNIGASDFDRTGRQRKVISAMFDKAQGLGLLQLNDLANAVLPCVSTNLSQGEVFFILLHALEYLDYELVSFRIPMDGTYKNLMIYGMSVLGIEFESNLQAWYDTVYGPESTEE